MLTDADVTAGVPDAELHVATCDGSCEAEGWRVRKDGSLFWANVVITAMFGDDRRLIGFGKVTRDATVAHQYADRMLSAAADLECARADAVRAAEAQQAFTASVSRTEDSHNIDHRLRRGTAGDGRYAGIGRRFMNTVYRNAQRLNQTIDDLLILSETERGTNAIASHPPICIRSSPT